MSLATRCPACGTVFRIVPDQLKVSDGWVRCGRCSDVFDASQVLFDLDTGSLPQSPPQPMPAVMPPAGAAGGEPQARAAARAAAGQQPPTDSSPDGPASAAPAASSAASPAVSAAAVPVVHTDGSLSASVASPEPVPAAPAWPETATTELEATGLATTKPLPAAGAEPAPPDLESTESAESAESAVPADSTEAASPAAEPAASESAAPAPAAPVPAEAEAVPQPLPGFLARAQQAQAARRHRRLPLALAAAALVLLLAGQVGLHFRDLIAAGWPAAQPALAAACRALGCELRAPLAIEQVSVESFTLRRIEGTPAYLLQLALRSRAPHDVRMPAIDLTLSDLQGRTLVRRMLDARELGAAGDRLPPQRELTLQALVELGDLPVAGYTAELFYP